MNKAEVIFLYDLIREVRRGLDDPGAERDDLIDAVDEAVVLLESYLSPEEMKYEN